MKSKIETMFEMLERLFDGKYNPLQFSCDMEDYFADNYDEIERENQAIATIFNIDVPELCSEGEPGFDPTHMIDGLKKRYEEAKRIYNKKQ